MSETTFNIGKSEPLTTEKLLEALSIIQPYKMPSLPENRKVSKFEKMMNKIGWYRQTTVYVIDSRKLGLLTP